MNRTMEAPAAIEAVLPVIEKHEAESSMRLVTAHIIHGDILQRLG